MSMDGSGQAPDVQLLINEARTVSREILPPSSVNHESPNLTVAQLVSQLYDPTNAGNPTKIKTIQEHLQTLQKGPQAWLVANALLSDGGTDSRFFGALTFTVKINNDWYMG